MVSWVWLQNQIQIHITSLAFLDGSSLSQAPAMTQHNRDPRPSLTNNLRNESAGATLGLLALWALGPLGLWARPPRLLGLLGPWTLDPWASVPLCFCSSRALGFRARRPLGPLGPWALGPLGLRRTPGPLGLWAPGPLDPQDSCAPGSLGLWPSWRWALGPLGLWP